MSLSLVRLLVALLLLVLIRPGAQAKERPMLAVLDLVSGGAELTQEELSLLSDVSRAEARRVLGGAYTIITQESIQQLLKAHGKTLEQCQGECETETGKLLGAEVVVSGRLVKAFGAYKANLKLHRTEPPELLDARVLTVNTLPGLEGAVRQGTAQILSSLLPAGARGASRTSSRRAQPRAEESLERTANEMARALAKRARDQAAKRAAKEAAERAEREAAEREAKRAAQRAARERAARRASARAQSGPPERCEDRSHHCVRWIEEDVWASVGLGPTTVQGDPAEVTGFSAVFEFFKLRYPYTHDSFLLTKIGALMMPSAITEQDVETRVSWASVAVGWGFASDSVTGYELSLGAASGDLSEDGASSPLVGPVVSLGIIWQISGVPWRMGLLAATLGNGSLAAPRTAVMTNWNIGVEF